jgi:hypothetical protein
MRLVSAYLFVWVPVSFAAELMSALPSLAMRGLAAIVELAAHGLVAAFSVAAARMQSSGSPARFTAASVAVAASGLVAIQSLYWTALPRNTPPGTQVPLTVVWIVLTLVLLAVIQRRRRRHPE